MSEMAAPARGTRQAPQARRAVPTVAVAALFAAVGLTAVAAAQISHSLAIPRAIMAGRDLGVPFHTLQGIAIDLAHGEVVVTDPGRHEVVTFDSTGNLLGWFVHRVTLDDGRTIDGDPAWVAIDRAGHLLVSDLRVTWVDVLDLRGRSVGRLQLPGAERGFEHGAGVLAVAPSGEILVATRGAEARIHRFDKNHRHIGEWGVAGTDSGRIAAVTGIAVSPDGRVHVACATTSLAVQVFDAEGRFEKGFGLHDIGPGNFSLPSGIVVTADGRTWVADEIRQVVQVFDPAGKFVGMMGGLGTAPGEFRYPRALASDGRDLLATAERVGNRVQVWRTQ
jgi:DNA-binding beta-propeller fold protein YncE